MPWSWEQYNQRLCFTGHRLRAFYFRHANRECEQNCKVILQNQDKGWLTASISFPLWLFSDVQLAHNISVGCTTQ